MTQDQIKTSILAVINTLNTVELKGRDNMNRLLGSIVTLEKLVTEIEKENDNHE